MKFLVDEKIQSEARAVNFADVGIHDNVELTEVKAETSPNGNNFLAFTFTTEDGKTLTKTEWQPTDTESDVLIRKAQNQAKRIKHIMSKFVSEADTKIEYDTDNWMKYASTVKAKLTPFIKGVKVRIKAIYDNNNYVTLPNYIPFIERMDVSKSTLEILSIDKVKREEADREAPVENPFEADTPQASDTVAQPPADNDLPF
jgi:hypothetical protein